LGQREIIIELFEKSNIDYEIIKDRLIYKCTTVNELSLDHNCSVENASFEDFDELVQMSMDNYIEEYEGKGEKTLEEMQGMVANGISESSLYILRSDSELSSMLQIINPGRDYPMIGNLFTKKEMRGRGYASILLYTVTNGLLNNGFEMCGLISDVKNAASNKAFIKVGYTPIYKWIFISKSDSNTTNMPG
jgi:predicted GNAT family acetyltransferase